jgi:hypothetical protein
MPFELRLAIDFEITRFFFLCRVVPVAIHQWMNLPDRLTAQGLLQQVVQAVVAQPDNS